MLDGDLTAQPPMPASLSRSKDASSSGGTLQLVARPTRSRVGVYGPSQEPPWTHEERTLSLHVRHPTAMVFLDETGAISRDRIFAVGCLKLSEPSILVRRLQKLRDRHHWYDDNEIHFAQLTKNSLPVYREIVDTIAAYKGGQFSCFVTDRNEADPVARYGTHWLAYEKMSQQLLIGSISPSEIVSVLADDYSTPDDVTFEVDVRDVVNERLGRCAITSICRLDSRAALPLQAVDLLTSAVAFEYRQAAGEAGAASPKAQLAEYVRTAFGVSSWLRPPVLTERVNVRKYTPGKASSRRGR